LFIFNGINYASGNTVNTTNSSNYIVTDTYTKWGGRFTNPFAWFFILTGLFLILFAAINYLKPESKDEDED
jgi:hypothetical protein